MIAVWRALPAVLLELVLGLHAAVGDVLSHHTMVVAAAVDATARGVRLALALFEPLCRSVVG